MSSALLKLTQSSNIYFEVVPHVLDPYIPSNFWLWTCFIVLLFIIMFKSGDSLVLCLVPTVMLVVLS